MPKTNSHLPPFRWDIHSLNQKEEREPSPPCHIETSQLFKPTQKLCILINC